MYAVVARSRNVDIESLKVLNVDFESYEKFIDLIIDYTSKNGLDGNTPVEGTETNKKI